MTIGASRKAARRSPSSVADIGRSFNSGRAVELHPTDQGERQIGEQAALVNLVEEHGADAVEKRIALQALDEDALGDEEDAGVAGEVALEADLPADLAAQRPALLVGDPARRGPGGDPARLEDEDLPAAGDPRRRERRRHPRRLAGPRRRLQHGIAARPQRREEVGQNFVDRQDGQRAHAAMLSTWRNSQGHTRRTHTEDTHRWEGRGNVSLGVGARYFRTAMPDATAISRLYGL